MRLLRAALIAGLAVGSTVWAAPVAHAACHLFMVSASSPVTEGGNVIVTVTRDGAVQDSNITVFTVDGSASAGSDYTATEETITFTGGSTSKSITVPTTNDTTVESDETFSLRLKNPGGCGDATFDFDDTATVTLKDNDNAPTTAADPTPEPTTTLKATTTSTPTTVAGATTTSSSTSSTTSTTVVEDDSDDSSSVVALLIGALLLVGAAAIATALVLRRHAAGGP